MRTEKNNLTKSHRHAVRALTFAALITPASAWAHPSGAAAVEWSLGATLLVVLVLYTRGLSALWSAAQARRGVKVRHAILFAAGWALLALALLPPFANLSADSFSLHMVQHEVLMVAAAPLLVLGRPLAVWTWGLPSAWRPHAARPFRGERVRHAWRVLSDPIATTVLHGFAIWLWHAPPLFQSAQASFGLHTLQHAAFLTTALLFWWSVLRPRTRAHAALGVAVLCLFATMLHTGALGVLLTFAQEPWYSSGAEAGRMGLSPLEDQQLGGLIMWIPGGLVYVAAALGLGAQWFTDEPRVARETSP